MKLKKTLAITLVTVGIAVTGYVYADSQTKVVEISALPVTHKDLSELEDRSKLIVTGKPLDSENHVVKDKDGFIQEGFTITSFKIDDVYSDKTEKKIKKGDIIKVAEPLYIIDNGLKPGQTEFVVEDYKKMNQSNRYLLVLKPDVNYSDLNVIAGGKEGQYNLNGTKLIP
ncbi:hypothetical protein ACFOQM_17660 [Paenibacillus sp. GCM10012307]|uniref:Uncharacterized protein n=1 Tax=Paenibacillus roseus TaxID=2798579 RepID=A0A934J9D7_9BACL|nr:hypothetical protein [Paenibacillus roseus]MBJ6363051.1 hypothetical protein [Paenibacillus roseus]